MDAFFGMPCQQVGCHAVVLSFQVEGWPSQFSTYCAVDTRLSPCLWSMEVSDGKRVHMSRALPADRVRYSSVWSFEPSIS